MFHIALIWHKSFPKIFLCAIISNNLEKRFFLRFFVFMNVLNVGDHTQFTDLLHDRVVLESHYKRH